MVNFYARTNENLASIVAGLDVCSDDFILCVGGSGDQTLAISEFANKVLSVDPEQHQVDHIKRLVELVGLADYVGFFYSRLGSYSHGDGALQDAGRLGNEMELCLLEEEKRTKYFTLERLSAIREKLPSIEVRRGCIFEAAQIEAGYTKVYLSNALGYSHLDRDSPYREFSIFEGLEVISRGLPPGGLVYISDGYEVSYNMFDVDNPFEIFGLQLDAKLTSRIHDPCWWPAVLRKV